MTEAYTGFSKFSFSSLPDAATCRRRRKINVLQSRKEGHKGKRKAKVKPKLTCVGRTTVTALAVLAPPSLVAYIGFSKVIGCFPDSTAKFSFYEGKKQNKQNNNSVQ